MAPDDRGGAPISLLRLSPAMRANTNPPNADLVTRRRRSAADDCFCRGRVQKLRWLGLDEEADRLSAGLCESHVVGAIPETD